MIYTWIYSRNKKLQNLNVFPNDIHLSCIFAKYSFLTTIH